MAKAVAVILDYKISSPSETALERRLENLTKVFKIHHAMLLLEPFSTLVQKYKCL